MKIHLLICIMNDVIDKKIRQASAYGFGVLGKCGGSAFAKDCVGKRTSGDGFPSRVCILNMN